MDPYTKDVIQVVASVAITTGLFASFGALICNIRATNRQSEAVSLQKRAIESSLFQKLARATSDIVAKPSTPEDPHNTLAQRNESVYTLNYISLLILHDYLPKEMKPYFKDDIVGSYQVLKGLTPAQEKTINPSQYRYLLKCGKKFAEEELLQEQPQSQ